MNQVQHIKYHCICGERCVSCSGEKLAGFIGFVLAVPIAAAVLEYVNDIAKEKHIFEE